MPICQYCQKFYEHSNKILSSDKPNSMIIGSKCPNPQCDKVIDHPRDYSESDEEFESTNEVLSGIYSHPIRNKYDSLNNNVVSSYEAFNEKLEQFTEENSDLMCNLVAQGYEIKFSIERVKK